MSQAAFAIKGRNPDVLTCIANLSNDEVFTPPELADSMLDALAVAWAERNDGASIWEDKNVRFLDPFTKSGVFLRGITKRLVDGLANEIPDLGQRVDHVLTQQVYGIAITELTSLLARRSVYCSKYANGQHSIAKSFSTSSGNIWYERTDHTWVNARCMFCGASQNNLDRGDELETHAYTFIHTYDIRAHLAELFGDKMQFDVVIGNPPYQLDDGGFGTSAAPIYQKFVTQAKALDPRLLAMVIPARWFTGGKGLDDFRKEMLEDTRVRNIVVFEDSRDCFQGVDVAGGITYFLWERDNPGLCAVTNQGKDGQTSTAIRPLLEDGAKVFIRSNESLGILRKVFASEGSTQFGLPQARRLSSIVSARKPFGFPSNFRGRAEKSAASDVLIYQNGGTAWVRRDEVSSGQQLVDRWKVLVSYTSSEHAGQSDREGKRRVLARVEPMPPGTVGTESYLVAGPFDNADQVDNVIAYLKSRFARFLISHLVTTQHVTRGSFEFVPLQDFTEPWTDDKLYEKYGINEDEIEIIESLVRPMDLAND